MERVNFPHRLPGDPIISSHHSNTVSVYGTARGQCFRVDSASVEEQTLSSFAIDRIQVVERWNCIIVLTGSRLLVISLLTLKKDDGLPLPPNQTVVSFAVDEQGDRLFVGIKMDAHKYRVTMLRRHHVSDGKLRLDILGSLDIDDVSPRDLILVQEHGIRWLYVSSSTDIVLFNTDQRPFSVSSKSQPGADFLTSGILSNEVAIIRGSECSFRSPSTEPHIIKFSGELWQTVVIKPYVIGVTKPNQGSKFGLVEVRLAQNGELIQTIQDIEEYGRLSVSAQPTSNLIILAGGDTRKRTAFRVIYPLTKQVKALISQKDFTAALALAETLEQGESHMSDGRQVSGGHSDSEVPELIELCCFELASQLLLRRPACSTEDVKRAGALLANFPAVHRALDFVRLFRATMLFADTDLFPVGGSIEQNAVSIRELFPNDSQDLNKPDHFVARFKPGTLSYAVREVLIPILLHVRSVWIANKHNALAKLDSLLLRAFSLGRPSRGAESASFDESKKVFLSDNLCDVEESERLLLLYPEMWEDHAALLEGKGRQKQALEWLHTLAKNAVSVDVEKYATAAVKLLAGHPSSAKEASKWMLERAPTQGIEVLVRYDCFGLLAKGKQMAAMLNDAKQFFGDFSKGNELEQIFLERCVSFHGDNCPEEVVDELVRLYLKNGNRTALRQLLLSKSEGPILLDYVRLLGDLHQWPDEQALALDRLERYREAARLLATKCVLEDAESYAAKRLDRDNTLFDMILDGYLDRPDATIDRALDLFVRNYDNFRYPAKALQRFPDDIPMEKCMALVKVAIADKAAEHRDQLITRKLLNTERLNIKARSDKQKARYVVVEAQSPLCSKCSRPFKAESPLVVWNQAVWHFACIRTEHPEVMSNVGH